MTPRPLLPQTAPNQWLSTKQVLDQAHSVGHGICLMGNFGSRTLYIPGWNVLELQFETLLTQSSFLPPSFHSDLKAPSAYSNSLPLSFTRVSHSKSLGCFLLSWHLLLRKPKPTVTSKPFSKVGQNQSPTSNMHKSQLLCLYTNTAILCLFHFNCSSLCVVVSHCGINFYSPND